MLKRQASRRGPSALLTGLPPLAAADARVLILGSMPGAESLRLQQYYAHPQNRFWPSVETVLGIEAGLTYAERVAALLDGRVAVWDVLRHCARDGSLDADIVPDTEVANDLAGFIAGHPELRVIFFNGRKAEAAFRRHVPAQPGTASPPLISLPSTSPANASIAAADRLRAWQQVADWLRR